MCYVIAGKLTIFRLYTLVLRKVITMHLFMLTNFSNN